MNPSRDYLRRNRANFREVGSIHRREDHRVCLDRTCRSQCHVSPHLDLTDTTDASSSVYQSEIVPASFRGFVVVSLQLFLNAGSLMATGINKRYSTRTDSSGWKTVTGIQFIFPICMLQPSKLVGSKLTPRSAVICAFVPFIPDSPRWLLSKDRWDDAVTSMRRLRPKSESADGTCELEVQSIKEALQAQVHKAPWTNLVKGTNFRRTMLVLGSYTFQQITGQAFVSVRHPSGAFHP